MKFQEEIRGRDWPLIYRLLLIMKAALLFTLLGVLQATAASIAQTITLEAKQLTLPKVMEQVQRQSGYQFFLTGDDVRDMKISADIHSVELKKAMEILLADLPVEWTLKNETIVVRQKSPMKPMVRQKLLTRVAQQPLEVSGTVTDSLGNVILGAGVVVKGNPNKSTRTDANGKYIIEVPENTVLVFSYVGYLNQEIPINGREKIDVVLFPDNKGLDEVVVVGYGTQKKASVVGAITTVKPEQLQFGTSRSLSNNLAGVVSGVIGVQRSGEPGYDDSNFWIRGISTFQSAGRDPLVLIDGVERSLNNIDPEEIESFSVLKDAAASAVYGVRGANGVILINTKRGKIGEPVVVIRSETAVTRPVRLPQYIGAADHMAILDEIRVDGGLSPIYGDAIAKTRANYDPDLYPDVNWVDAITNDQAYNQRTTMNISGGTERLRYSFVGAFYDERGILARDDRNEWDSSIKLRRYNVRSNVDMNLTPTTLLRFNLGGYLQDRNAPPQGINDLFSSAFTATPFVHPTQYSSGQIPRTEEINPWASATQTGFRRESGSKIESLFSIEQDLGTWLPGLKAKGVFSFDRFSSNHVSRSKAPDYYSPANARTEEGDLILTLRNPGSNFLGYATGSQWGSKNIYLEGSLSYGQQFGNHGLEGLFLYNQRSYDVGEALPYRNQGIAGRTSYTYNNRYVAEFNFGYNGSENFARGSRFGFFPSGAIGWIVSEEAFMQPLQKVISSLKIRASYGLVGNDKLSGRRFAYIPTIQETSNLGYAWGYDSGYSRTAYTEGDFGVADLSWETVVKTNIGIDLGLYNGAAQLQLDYFNEDRRDIFMQRGSVPATGGFFRLPWSNYGKVNNRGIEASLTLNKQFTGDFAASFYGNLTFVKNKIIERDEPYTVIGTNRAVTGHAVSQLFGLVADGLFSAADFTDASATILKPDVPEHTFGNVRPGDIKYRDLNNDGRVDALDETAIGGTFDPRLVYGAGISLRYKRVDLSVLVQGIGNTYSIIGNGAPVFLPGSGNGATGNILDNVDDRWTVDHPSHDVFYPRLSMGFNPNNARRSTWWLRDLGFVRIRNLEGGYSFSSEMLQKVRLNQGRIFVRGNNLFTFSDFKLWDPEVSTSNGSRYPVMKSLSMGIEFKF